LIQPGVHALTALSKPYSCTGSQTKFQIFGIFFHGNDGIHPKTSLKDVFIWLRSKARTLTSNPPDKANTGKVPEVAGRKEKIRNGEENFNRKNLLARMSPISWGFRSTRRDDSGVFRDNLGVSEKIPRIFGQAKTYPNRKRALELLAFFR
jgi:hypothetical protein